MAEMIDDTRHSPLPWRYVTGLKPGCLSCESNGVVGSEVRDANDAVVFYDGHDTGMMGHEGDWPFIITAVNERERLRAALRSALKVVADRAAGGRMLTTHKEAKEVWDLGVAVLGEELSILDVNLSDSEEGEDQQP